MHRGFHSSSWTLGVIQWQDARNLNFSFNWYNFYSELYVCMSVRVYVVKSCFIVIELSSTKSLSKEIYAPPTIKC